MPSLNGISLPASPCRGACLGKSKSLLRINSLTCCSYFLPEHFARLMACLEAIASTLVSNPAILAPGSRTPPLA